MTKESGSEMLPNFFEKTIDKDGKICYNCTMIVNTPSTVSTAKKKGEEH